MQIMLLLQRQTILRLTTVLLLILWTLLRGSQARTVDVSPEKSETITFIHDDDKIAVYRSHDNDVAGKGLETDEDNEVISVRLLNSFQLLKPYAGLEKEEEEEEGQNVSYENMLESEDGPVEVTSRNGTAVMSLLETSTVSTSTSSSSTTRSSSTTSSSSSTSRSTTVEVSAEQPTTTRIKPVILSTRPPSTTTSTTLRPTASTSTVKPIIVTPQPMVFGTRKRTARNHDDYYQYPSIDLDQLEFDDLEYSNVDGMRLKELLATRFIPESLEHLNRDQPANKDCTCATEKPQSATVIGEDYDYYQDFPTPSPPPAVPMMPHHANARFARRKRLQRQQPELASDEYLPPAMPMDAATSMERAERMHGALERIMGIVTIMSHVDNFIQKKTKQSIRRLARLYESSEK